MNKLENSCILRNIFLSSLPIQMMNTKGELCTLIIVHFKLILIGDKIKEKVNFKKCKIFYQTLKSMTGHCYYKLLYVSVTT